MKNIHFIYYFVLLINFSFRASDNSNAFKNAVKDYALNTFACFISFTDEERNCFLNNIRKQIITQKTSQTNEEKKRIAAYQIISPIIERFHSCAYRNNQNGKVLFFNEEIEKQVEKKDLELNAFKILIESIIAEKTYENAPRVTITAAKKLLDEKLFNIPGGVNALLAGLYY